MGYGLLPRSIRTSAAAVLMVCGLAGCSGGEGGGEVVVAKAEAVDVTYYYLPG